MGDERGVAKESPPALAFECVAILLAGGRLERQAKASRPSSSPLYQRLAFKGLRGLLEHILSAVPCPCDCESPPNRDWGAPEASG